MVQNKVVPSEQVWIRHGPSNGLCSLCGEHDDANNIFFQCQLAKFIWACVRELLSYAWNPAGAGEFPAIAQGGLRVF
jgi:hypothetical protein